MTRYIDFNTDFGEGYGVYPFPMQVWRTELENGGPIKPPENQKIDPDYILSQVSSINLACGFHGGDPLVIKRYGELAHHYSCWIGAHPSFPDIQGFGNRYMELTNAELKAILQYQIGALEGLLRISKQQVEFVKCHGTLYNRSTTDEKLATSIVEGIAEYRNNLKIVVPPKSAIEHVAKSKGVPTLLEGFADRNYENNGDLVSRRKPNAMVTEPEEIAKRVLKMIKDNVIVAVEGTKLQVDIDTVCFHADTPNVNESLSQTVKLLKENDISLNKKAKF